MPSSFADLAEELMPSVVNISTTQTIKTQSGPFPFQFPPGSPFGEMLKNLKSQQRERQLLWFDLLIKRWNSCYQQSCNSERRRYYCKS